MMPVTDTAASAPALPNNAVAAGRSFKLKPPAQHDQHGDHAWDHEADVQGDRFAPEGGSSKLPSDDRQKPRSLAASPRPENTLPFCSESKHADGTLKDGPNHAAESQVNGDHSHISDDAGPAAPFSSSAVSQFKPSELKIDVPVDDVKHSESTPSRAWRCPIPWWAPGLIFFAYGVALLVAAVAAGPAWARIGSPIWWTLTILGHLPLIMIFAFLAIGMAERIMYFRYGRTAKVPGRMPAIHPLVCVQLPMFNEHAVAQRVIEAACGMTWPADRLEIQVLDDSTDADTRALVNRVCADIRASGIICKVRNRVNRKGYKAGALEEGRHETEAEFIVIFDADFMPPSDYLLRVIPHFYDQNGSARKDLALVQAQWGHLNHDESVLTRAQTLWIDDHHTLQMSFRASMWRFVNFTGTAGVWRASAIESAGGWRSASLVEDCELSFRHLFAGFRTTFVKEVVVPAELPNTYTAYKAQQRRWTQGWVQLQRLHLLRLISEYQTTPMRRLALLYHMTISVQWPLWGMWIVTLPFLVYSDLWLGGLGPGWGFFVYLAPTLAWLILSTAMASHETRYTYEHWPLRSRLLRMLPYMAINTGMLPHQFMSFLEGLFGQMHSEFERTPKAGGAAAADQPKRKYNVRVHWPYVLAEVGFVALQLGWTVAFGIVGLWLCTVVSLLLTACVLGMMWFYGDHLDLRLFVLTPEHRAMFPCFCGCLRRPKVAEPELSASRSTERIDISPAPASSWTYPSAPFIESREDIASKA